jgi:hypothetical protein
MSKKYKYVLETDEVLNIETGDKYKFYVKNFIDGDIYYFRKNIKKNGDVSVYTVKYIKYDYKDITKINKSTLYNRIRSCNENKLKEIHEFFNQIQI